MRPLDGGVKSNCYLISLERLTSSLSSTTAMRQALKVNLDPEISQTASGK